MTRHALCAALLIAVSALTLSPPLLAQSSNSFMSAPNFVSMNPHFTVNLGDGSFVQMEAQTLVRNEQTELALSKHMAAVRHAIIMYLSNLYPEDLRTAQQREDLREDLGRIVKETLEQFNQPHDVRGFYITSLIMQ